MIPSIVHFIWIQGDLAFGLMHFLCMKSAREVLKPDKIMLHLVGDGFGHYWTRMLVEVKPELVPTDPVTRIGDWPATPPRPIQSGPIRLKALIDHGGIYLDTDVLCLKSFDDLLANKVVLAKESPYVEGLCNAVMLSEPGADYTVEFLKRFTAEYRGGWAETCTLLPNTIASEHPDWITVLGHESFFPHGYGNQAANIFEQNMPVDQSYAMHLWASGCFFRYMDGMTEDDVRNGTSTFSVQARKFL